MCRHVSKHKRWQPCYLSPGVKSCLTRQYKCVIPTGALCDFHQCHNNLSIDIKPFLSCVYKDRASRNGKAKLLCFGFHAPSSGEKRKRKKTMIFVFKQWSKRQNNCKVSKTSRVISIANCDQLCHHIVMTDVILAHLQEVPTLHQKLAEVDVRFIPHSWWGNLVENKRKKAWDINAGHSNIGTFSLNAQCCKRVAKTHIYLLCFLRRNWGNWRAKRLILGGFQFWVLVIA